MAAVISILIHGRRKKTFSLSVKEKEDLIDPEAIHSCLVEKKGHDLLVQMQVPLQEE